MYNARRVIEKVTAASLSQGALTVSSYRVIVAQTTWRVLNV